MRERLAGKTGAIKRDLAIADHPDKPHIVPGRTTFSHQHVNRGDDPVLHGGFVMAWAVLFTAGLLEIGWAIGLKYTEGFTRPVPSVLTLASMIGSIVLLGLALKSLPVGTGYAVWTGIGTVGTALLGIALFGEPATALRLISIGLIMSGIVGLKLVT
jgi:quaternary ammonium compound-resistance protein SugE